MSNENGKLLIETMSLDDKKNLVAFLKEMNQHPEFIKYQTMLYERYEVVRESVMMTEADNPYQRGYAVGCLHSATFDKDFIEQIEAEERAEANKADEDKAEEQPLPPDRLIEDKTE